MPAAWQSSDAYLPSASLFSRLHRSFQHVLLPSPSRSVILQVKLPKEVAQAYALAQLQASEADAERALSLFTATGTAVLVQGKLTTTPEGTKQVCTMLLLHHALSWRSFGPPVAAEAPVAVLALPSAACDSRAYHCLSLPLD